MWDSFFKTKKMILNEWRRTCNPKTCVCVCSGFWRCFCSTVTRPDSGSQSKSALPASSGSSTTTTERRSTPPTCWRKPCWRSATGPTSTREESCWCSTCRVKQQQHTLQAERLDTGLTVLTVHINGCSPLTSWAVRCCFIVDVRMKCVCLFLGVGEILTDPSVIKSGEKG